MLKGIRENEPRATSLGYQTDNYKLIAFILSCALSGVAGGTKAIVFGIATLTDVHYSTSGEVVLTTLVGGLGTVFGPVMGAVVVTAMENYLAEFGAWVTVTQGAIFMLCVLAFRRGIIGELGGQAALVAVAVASPPSRRRGRPCPGQSHLASAPVPRSVWCEPRPGKARISTRRTNEGHGGPQEPVTTPWPSCHHRLLWSAVPLICPQC